MNRFDELERNLQWKSSRTVVEWRCSNYTIIRIIFIFALNWLHFIHIFWMFEQTLAMVRSRGEPAFMQNLLIMHMVLRLLISGIGGLMCEIYLAVARSKPLHDTLHNKTSTTQWYSPQKRMQCSWLWAEKMRHSWVSSNLVFLPSLNNSYDFQYSRIRLV